MKTSVSGVNSAASTRIPGQDLSNQPKTKGSKRPLPWPVMNEEKCIVKPRGRHLRPNRGTLETPETPEKGPNMPWNATLSAHKAKKQELKVKGAIQKRSLSTQAGDPGVCGKKRPMQPAKIFLSEEQKRVIDIVLKQGKSVFFTGSAGELTNFLSTSCANDFHQVPESLCYCVN